MPGLRVYWIAFRTTLQTRLEYRADLVLGLLGALGLQAASLGTLWVVLHNRGDLAGWRPAEIGVLFALTVLVQGMSELFFNHVWFTPAYILRGTFDRLLVYPVRSLPFFLLTSPELHSLGNIGGGSALLLLFWREAGLSPWGLALVPLWVFCGSLIHTSVLVLCSAAIIRMRGGQFQILFLTNTILYSTRYPLSIYPAALQGLLLVFLPLGISSFLPVSALTGRLPWTWAILGPPLAALIFVSLAWSLWDRAFRTYESTGS
jgi:ABC-2 type transport system permease protein